MVILDQKHQEEILSYFKNVKGVMRTTGTGEGLIVKFATFYLKIYQGEHGSDYLVQHFKYNNNQAYRFDTVPANEMRLYARSLRTE